MKAYTLKLPVIATLLTLSNGALAAHDTHSINDSWTFNLTGDTAKTAVHLPHSWNSDAYYTHDYNRTTGVYTRKLNIPADMKGKTIYLKFDGAANKSTILIDGTKAGSHVGGYSPHVIDITPYVTPGSTHDLTVEVNNADSDIPPYSADFTFMGGLYRDAWLIARDNIHLDFNHGPACGFKVTALPDGKGDWEVIVDGDLLNNSSINTKTEVTFTLYGPDGNQVATTKKGVKADAGKVTPFKLTLSKLHDVDLWSPDSPTLYRADITVSAGNKIIDRQWCNTAFRTFSFDYEGRFILNGKPLKLRGMCRHQDQAPMGIGLTDEQHRRDMRLLKDMGANFIRISHYPQDDAILEMCDRLGLIAWEEIPVIDYVPINDRFADNAELMTREMIRRHYNHPSVVMWGYMNEIFLRIPSNGRASAKTQAEDRGKTVARTEQLAERLNNAVKEEDPTRLTTMAFHASDEYNSTQLGELTDVKGWNLYNGWYGGQMGDFEKYLSAQHSNHPHHKLIVSEYGAGSDRRIHSLNPEPFDFSIEYQQKFLEHYLSVIEDSAYVAGGSHWNFIDFSSANREESMPHINNKGLVTNDRTPKDVYYYYKAKWDGLDSVAHIAVSDWPVYTELVDESGTVNLPVKVYTNIDAVELCLNGKSLGIQQPDNCTTIFDIPCKPGRNILSLYSAANATTPLDSREITLNAINVVNGKIALSQDDELAINVGSNCYVITPSSNLTWLPDSPYTDNAIYGYTGGKLTSTQSGISLCETQALLQHNNTGLETYTLNVIPGDYEIELSWAELSKPSALSAYMLGHQAASGDQLPTSMSVDINGTTVETSITPGLEAGDKTRLTRRYRVSAAADGIITISFSPLGDGATTSLSALKLRRL